MNLTRLYEILRDTTTQFRKGSQVEKRETPATTVTTIWLTPHVSEMPEGVEAVDVEFMVVGVDRTKALAHRAELVEILNEYPKGRLHQGPSYIEVGAEIGDQGAAFCLFALGKVLKFWDIVTPTTLGIEDEALKREAAGAGFVMVSGYHP